MEVQRKYGVQTTVYFPLLGLGVMDFTGAAVHVVGDSVRTLDGAAFGNTANAFVHEGNGLYSLILSVAEMQCEILSVLIIDQTAPKVWEDQALLVQTYGNANASFAFDLDTATVVAASVTGNVGGNIVGNVNGTVASVVGAVGSVAGNVAGNVTGTVGSVIGAVGSVAGNVAGNVVGSVGSVIGAVGSVAGAVGSVIGNVGGNVVGTVGSVIGAVGSVIGNVGGNVVGTVASVVGTVGSIAAGGITAASYAAGALVAIGAAVIATVYEGVETVAEGLRLIRSAVAGKLSGGGTFTLRFRNRADTRDRIVATVDAAEDRTNIVTDVLP